MQIYIKKCDMCSKEARSDTEKELYDKYGKLEVKLNHNLYNQWTQAWTEYQLCPECLYKLGCVEVAQGEKKYSETLEQKLFNVIYEVAQCAL